MLINFVQAHTHLFYWMHSAVGYSDFFDRLIILIAEDIDIYIVFIAVVFILSYKHTYRHAAQKILKRQVIIELLIIFSGVMLAWGISYLMKIGFAAPRPFLRFSDVQPLFPYGGYNSFPSGHATLFSSLGSAIYLLHRRVGIVFIVLAILIGLARVIAGVHFPVDILFGWVLGAMTSYFSFIYINFKITPSR